MVDTMTETVFQGFPKITRYNNVGVTITEKIDGTNACLIFDENGTMFCQSRNKIINPGKQTDNAGFASWAVPNQTQLFELLGPGRHFGEWWGIGIQRNYGLMSRRLSLFNTHRWGGRAPVDVGGVLVDAVPVLTQCPLGQLNDSLGHAAASLIELGSSAAPGFMDPEGVMIYLSNIGYLKHPFDPNPKGQG